MQQLEQEIVEKFRDIKRRQYLAIIPFIAIVTLLIFSSEDPSFTILGLSNEILMMISGVFVVISLIFSVVNWRCPNCNSYLGREFSPKFCRNCGVRLED